jgi:hypothetical protein
LQFSQQERGSITKSGAKQKRSQNSDNRWGQAVSCVFEDLGGRAGLVKNTQETAWPPNGRSLSWPKTIITLFVIEPRKGGISAYII